MVRASDVLLCLVAILFPPAATGFITGCSCDLLINILLTSLGYLPGHLHAGYIIYKRIQAEEMYGPEGYVYTGNVTFEPIDQPGQQYQRNGPQQGYGAVSQA